MENFYDVVNRLCDLYISYHGRYVMMLPQEGKIFVPKTRSGPAKLTNRVVCQHVNRQIAISVFAGACSSKFICFDVDYPEPAVVKKLIEIIAGYGVPRDLIYVSTSGDKGYHVEIFFDGLVYTEQLRKFYDCVCADGDFDPHKIEFRPTSGQAIKLPLSMHCKTRRVCWYLDQETLQPIEDPAYVLQIQKMAMADFAIVLETLPPRKPFDMPENETVPMLKMKRADLDQLEGDGYPNLLEPGHRHNTMLAIGIHNRYRGLSQERNRAELLAWAARQPEGFLLQAPAALEREADDIMRWVYSEQFALKAATDKPVVFTPKDIAYWAGQPNRICRRLMFLLVWGGKYWNCCQMSYERIAKFLGVTDVSVSGAVRKMVEGKQISVEHGRVRMKDGKLMRTANRYYLFSPEPDPIAWDCMADEFMLEPQVAAPTPENFMEVYKAVLRAMVPEAQLKKIMGAKEYAEMQSGGCELCGGTGAEVA